jgi:SAM-dependent methyltransferase
MRTDPTSRFSSRVENYIRYRPKYPQAVVKLLEDECGLTPVSIVADVGSGTGILTELFLRNGNRVFGVEPNREMREAGERLLAAYPNFLSVEGRSEATRLESSSVDFITAGQAFHWFERETTRREFARLLRPGGWVVLVWNDRRTQGTRFLEDYERMLIRYGTDYCEVTVKHANEDLIGSFFGEGGFRSRSFDNLQLLNFDELKGRLLSSSYIPEASDARFAPMMRELEDIYARHNRDGRVSFDYDTKVFYGQLK